MILAHLCAATTLFLLSCSLPLPPRHLGTWDPDEGQQEAFKAWLETHKRWIMAKDWTKVNPKDYIAHDKFNIADGYDIDLLVVEEMQLIGDPVLAAGNGASQRAGKQRRKRPPPEGDHRARPEA